jgi:hypothetical protein
MNRQEYNKVYYLRNRSRILKRKKIDRQIHLDKYKNQDRKQYLKFRDKILKRRKIYIIKNKENIKKILRI